MSDYEEPAAKISKIEALNDTFEEDMDEGQEEWLSEGILTDDDYNPAPDRSQNESNLNISQGYSTPSIPDESQETSQEGSQDTQTITEQPTDNVESTNQTELPEELGAFLIRKTDVKVENTKKAESDIEESVKHSDDDDDGHDTDELLALNDTFEEDMDEGQEEWLSEGILTDDDYNPAPDPSQNESNLNISQGYSTPSIPDESQETSQEGSQDTQTITEQPTDNVESTNQTELPEELGAFLIRKTDVKVENTKKAESDIEESVKHSDDDDDGHDTDELLRMLGGDDSKKIQEKASEEKETQEEHYSSDDDEFVFEGANMARLKVAKNSILKKYPSKAVPEESDRDTDMSSDEGVTMKRMFDVKKKSNTACKSTTKSGINALKTVTKRAVSIQKPDGKSSVITTPVPNTMTRKVVKLGPEELRKIRPETEETRKFVRIETDRSKGADAKRKVIRFQSDEKQQAKPEPDEIIDEEEFMEGDQFDLEEEFESDAEGSQQRIMRPEQMDEEMFTDGDTSHSDDESLYDELPSSDEEDMNEWFSLDVRSERAGDYIPLLGAKAQEILLAEKQRVSSRLTTLKQNVKSLNESSTQQAEMLRRATLQLAELDAALKA